jgi:antitoxin component of RelBE/YafQ-DinJ toxin-antitoxin module
MTEVFRVRLERKLVRQANEVAEEIGTSPGEIVRLMFKQLVKRRAVPFPLQADPPEAEVLSAPKRRSEMWDAMNEGRPATR